MTLIDSEAATALTEESAAALPEVIELRRSIHREPELGLNNPKTRDRILAALDGLDLEIKAGDGDVSWVTADLVGRDGPTVLLRADTDALPMTEDTDLDFRSIVEGAAHACGHDSHVAMLVGGRPTSYSAPPRAPWSSPVRLSARRRGSRWCSPHGG